MSYKRDQIEDGMRPVHPGEFIAEDLEELEMSAADYDVALAVPPGTIADVVAARANITSELALRLAQYLGTSARFWMNLRVNYDLKIARRQHGDAIIAQVIPLSRRQRKSISEV